MNESKEKIDLAPLLTAAQGVVSRAFEMASSAITMPLRTLSSIYWKQAIARAGLAPNDVHEINPETLMASSTGILYWIPSQGEHPEPFSTVEEQDAHLAATCIKMGRIVVDQIKIPMEPGFWQLGADSPVIQQVNSQIEAAFDSMVEAMLSGKTSDEVHVLATTPNIAFTESRDNPFEGLLTLGGRCGFWVPPPQA